MNKPLSCEEEVFGKIVYYTTYKDEVKSGRLYKGSIPLDIMLANSGVGMRPNYVLTPEGKIEAPTKVYDDIHQAKLYVAKNLMRSMEYQEKQINMGLKFYKEYLEKLKAL